MKAHKEIIFLLLLISVASFKIYAVYGNSDGDSAGLTSRGNSAYAEVVRNGVGRVYEIGKAAEVDTLSHGDSLEILDDGTVFLRRMSGGKLLLFGLPVEINDATVEDLTAVSGIGPVKAKAIVEFREKKGAFESLDELEMVRGLGRKTVEKIRPYLSCKSCG